LRFDAEPVSIRCERSFAKGRFALYLSLWQRFIAAGKPPCPKHRARAKQSSEMGLISSTLNGIYVAAVYQYAAEGQVSHFFRGEMLQGAFRRK
jgi:hypothetical protein